MAATCYTGVLNVRQGPGGVFIGGALLSRGWFCYHEKLGCYGTHEMGARSVGECGRHPGFVEYDPVTIGIGFSGGRTA